MGLLTHVPVTSSFLIAVVPFKDCPISFVLGGVCRGGSGSTRWKEVRGEGKQYKTKKNILEFYHIALKIIESSTGIWIFFYLVDTFTVKGLKIVFKLGCFSYHHPSKGEIFNIEQVFLADCPCAARIMIFKTCLVYFHQDDMIMLLWVTHFLNSQERNGICYTARLLLRMHSS